MVQGGGVVRWSSEDDSNRWCSYDDVVKVVELNDVGKMVKREVIDHNDVNQT